MKEDVTDGGCGDKLLPDLLPSTSSYLMEETSSKAESEGIRVQGLCLICEKS